MKRIPAFPRPYVSFRLGERRERELYEFGGRNEIDREFIPRPITIRPVGSLHYDLAGYALQLPRYRCRMTRCLQISVIDYEPPAV